MYLKDKNMKRYGCKGTALLLTVMAVFFMTGCAGSVAQDDVTQSDTGTKEEKKEETQSEPGDALTQLIEKTDAPVKLTVWASSEDQDLTRSIVDSFVAEYSQVSFDITVGVESEETARDTVLEQGENAADVYTFADDQIADLVKGEALLPVEEHYTFDPAQDNVESSVRAASIDDVLYAYPMTADNGYFLFYDDSVFDSTDVKSLDKMIEKAEEKNKKIAMNISNGWYLYSFFKGAGFELYEKEDGSNECNWNDEGGADVANAILDYIDTGVLVNMDDATMSAQIEEGEVAAAVNGTWRASDIQNAWGEHYAATKLPTVKIGEKEVQMASFSGCKLVGVNPKTQNSEWARVLAEYLTNQSSQEKRYESRLLVPSNKVAQSSAGVQADPAVAALAAQSEYADPQRVGTAYWEPSEKLGRALSDKKTKRADIQKLLDEAVEAITVKPDEEKQE